MNDTDFSLRLFDDERFARFEPIEWWDQSLLSQARVLVVGAGALGNEVIKNLCLLGAGNLVIADLDRVERTNLSRSVLFRESDEGQPKAHCAARAARELYPEVRAEPLCGNILADVGLGYFRWADVVVGALDNREARVFVNQVCARLGKLWIDGGIDVFQGVVRGFQPPKTSCYECTMSSVDWDMLNRRRSCSLVARRAVAEGGTPTTPITASVIGALQAQEVVKCLHRREPLAGRGYVFDGATFDSYPVSYPINPDCPWHEDEPIQVLRATSLTSDSRLSEVWDLAEHELGGLDAIEFAREIVHTLRCPSCGDEASVLKPAENVTETQLRCAQCAAEAVPTFVHSVGGDSDLLSRQLRDVGLPLWDILWARRDEDYIGVEIAGDLPLALNQDDSTDRG